MPRLAYGPWTTRTITVAGVNSRLPWNANFDGYSHGAARISTPGGKPWNTSSTRVSAYSQAIDTTSPDHSSSNSGTVTIPAAGGAEYRVQDAAMTVGYQTRTYADRVFFGTYLDGYSVTAFQARFGVSVGEWLRILYADRPSSTADTQPLSMTEWAALFGPDVPGGYREFSIPDCTITVHAAFRVDPALTGATIPTVQMHRDTPSTYYGGWLSPAVLATIPPTETAAGTIDLPTEIVLVASSGSIVPTPATLFDYQVASSAWYIESGMVDRADNVNYGWTRHLDIPDWTVGFDPGFDGDPTPVVGTTQFGGNAASQIGNVVVTLSATVTVRTRPARVVYGTPPLHQTGRPGVLDATEGYQSQLVTPQSSPIQSGML